jgi:hypothetical protein
VPDEVSPSENEDRISVFVRTGDPCALPSFTLNAHKLLASNAKEAPIGQVHRIGLELRDDCRTAGHYCRNEKTNSVVPPATATYWRPPTA